MVMSVYHKRFSKEKITGFLWCHCFGVVLILGLCVMAMSCKTRLQNETDNNQAASTDYVENDSIIPGLSMVYVEGGTFDMGATEEQGEDYSVDERPIHSITLSSYYISKYEITQAQWKAVMGTTIEQQKEKVATYYEKVTPLCSDSGSHPIIYVSWYEAKEFCEKLSFKTGKNYGLPTEAQWEFAARGGVKSKGYKYSGSNTIGEVAWYKDNSNGITHEVGTKASNELGIYDMSGNVWEWCADWGDYYNSSADTNPMGPDIGHARVLRGGAYNHVMSFCRVSNRDGIVPDAPGQGFRVVCLP